MHKHVFILELGMVMNIQTHAIVPLIGNHDIPKSGLYVYIIQNLEISYLISLCKQDWDGLLGDVNGQIIIIWTSESI